MLTHEQQLQLTESAIARKLALITKLESNPNAAQIVRELKSEVHGLRSRARMLRLMMTYDRWKAREE